MNVKIDVNINLNNIGAIMDRISKFMDLNRIDSSSLIRLDNKSQSLETSVEAIDNSYIEEVKEIEPEDITADKLRCFLTELSKEGKTEEARAILDKYNCTKISQLKKSDYQHVYIELSNIKNNL